MDKMWDFAGEHYIVALFMVWAICSVLRAPFLTINRWLRSRNITKNGWPTAPIDADGDVVYPNKDD